MRGEPYIIPLGAIARVNKIDQTSRMNVPDYTGDHCAATLPIRAHDTAPVAGPVSGMIGSVRRRAGPERTIYKCSSAR
jgi:hypothetical protein